jgi:hypothetical protein
MITLGEAYNLAVERLLPEERISGIGFGSQKIRLYVEDEEIEKKIPKTLAGFKVETMVVGRIKLLQVDRTKRIRPALGGISIGHPWVTAGTLGSRVYDLLTGRRVILSNNHVLAFCNQAKRGDPILQPGFYDGGTYPDDVIGYLERFVRIRVPPEKNLVDCAIATPTRNEDLSDEVLDIGIINEIEEARVGMEVEKSGRTTGLTKSVIIDTNATIKVYGFPWGFSIFEDQILVKNPFADAGDSGSVVVNSETKKAVGLIFSGSPIATGVNKMTNVARELRIDFKPTPLPRISMALPLLALPFLIRK